MGWLWRSNNQSQPSKEASDAAPSPPSTANVNPVEAQLGQQQQQQQQQSTREQQADAELQSFLRELNASTQATVAEPSPSSTANTPEDTSTKGRPSPLTDTTYPTTMSCRDAFDYAFHCQSLGGQLTNWYRYGTLRSCSDRWDDFWFCMRTRGYSDEQRAKEITRHFAQKETRYRVAPSSEDVWEQRRPGEELKNPFMKDPDLIDIPGLPRRRKSADEA